MVEYAGMLPLAGLTAGAIMGYVARRHHFCTMSALERYWYAGDDRGLRTWGLAILVAVVLSQALIQADLFEPRTSFYLTSDFGWTGAILGGIAFGFGMALTGTCGFGALVRLGGGSLRGLVVVVVLGLSALAAQRGILATGRVALVDKAALDLERLGAVDQSLGSLLSAATGTDMSLPAALFVIALLGAVVFGAPAFRHDRRCLISGTIIGAVVAFGWVATSWIAVRSFAPIQVESASFVMPPVICFCISSLSPALCLITV